MTIVTPTRPRRSRIAGPRTRSTFRTARRELGVVTSYVKTATGAVTLSFVHDAQVDARDACSRRMTIAHAAHEALHAEHSRQVHEAGAKLEALDLIEHDASGPDVAMNVSRRGVIRDLHAAQRELRLLNSNPPATPLRPRPRATPYDVPYVRAW